MDLLEYIRIQQNKGVNDYKILSYSKEFIKQNMYGGGKLVLTEDQIEELKKILETSDIKNKDALITAITNNEISDTEFATFEDLKAHILKETEIISLKKDTILYHPSHSVKKFNDSIVSNNEYSFSLFFTPNEEYAKRYSGLWSLNKRPVFVHKLRVKDDISGIKVLNTNNISDLDNLDLATKLCESKNTINGIKIQSEQIDEYYLCNPETLLEIVETWMQIGTDEWVNKDSTEQ